MAQDMTPDDWEALWQASRHMATEPLDGVSINRQPEPDMTLRTIPAAGAAVAARARTSRFFSASELAGLEVPDRDWLVDGLVPIGTVTMLSGDGGVGKSLLALQLAAAVALGTRWVGQPVTAGRALFISAEDDRDELHRRLADVAVGAGSTLRDLDRLTVRSLAGEDALLAGLTPDKLLHPSILHEELDRQLSLDKPALVVLDTLADLFPGNENDRAQARQFIGILRGLAIRHDCAVLLLAHPSLSGLNSGSGSSGSTGWNNSVRSRLYFDRMKDEDHEADPDLRILRTMKANYGRIGGELGVRWQDGVFVPLSQENGLDRMAATAKAERVFMKLLREFSQEGRTLSDKTSSAYAPTLFAKSGRAEGCTKRMLRSAMETLFVAGKIKMVESGPPSRVTRTMVEVL